MNISGLKGAFSGLFSSTLSGAFAEQPELFERQHSAKAGRTANLLNILGNSINSKPALAAELGYKALFEAREELLSLLREGFKFSPLRASAAGVYSAESLLKIELRPQNASSGGLSNYLAGVLNFGFLSELSEQFPGIAKTERSTLSVSTGTSQIFLSPHDLLKSELAKAPAGPTKNIAHSESRDQRQSRNSATDEFRRFPYEKPQSKKSRQKATARENNGAAPSKQEKARKQRQ